MLQHSKLKKLMQMAYSAEKAAAYAYQGHAASVSDPEEKQAIARIEQDEWEHRASVLELMREYNVPVSHWLEWKFAVIGRVISASCHVIGWFMPFYFAGWLESGNVCEYFRMLQYFGELGISKHDSLLFEMGMKEKEHEVFFRDGLKGHKLLPLFERFFSWGHETSLNDVDENRPPSIRESRSYCQRDD